MMLQKEDIINLICRIREKQGLSKSIKPKIIKLEYNANENMLGLLVADRPDKAIVIGHGGWTIYELQKNLNLNGIVVISKTDFITRKLRLIQTLKSLTNFKGKMEEKLKKILVPLIKSRIKSILWSIPKIEDSMGVAVALSGGADSTASLVIAKKLGLNTMAILVNPGTYLIPEYKLREIKNLSKILNTQLTVINAIKSIFDLYMEALKRRFHPCGRCSQIIAASIYKQCEELGYDIAFFGDLLPTGYHALLRVSQSLVRVNLPAALCLTKSETIMLAKPYMPSSEKLVYGCPMLREIQKRYAPLRHVSAQRVLREVRAGVIEPGQAIKLLKSIYKS